MEIQKDEIYKIALQYFPQDLIDKFIELISRWKSQTQSFFFQVAQLGDNLQLEFGGLVGEAIIDITTTKVSTKITTIQASTISAILLDDAENFTRLTIVAGGQIVGTYQAMLEKSRTELKEYAKNLQHLIILKRN